MKHTYKIIHLEAEINRACLYGHIVAVNVMKGGKGIEVVLPNSVDSSRAIVISRYFENKYGVRSCFFVKKHVINVYYE